MLKSAGAVAPLITCVLFGAAWAQASPPPEPPAAAKGTPIFIAIDDHLNSKTSKEGDTFRIHLATSIVVDGKTVAPAGATGMGEVINAVPSGLGGRAGELSLAVRYLDFEHQRVRIGHFHFGATGQDNGNLSMALMATVGIVGGLVTGGNVDVAPRTIGSAKLNEPLLQIQAEGAQTAPAPTPVPEAAGAEPAVIAAVVSPVPAASTTTVVSAPQPQH